MTVNELIEALSKIQESRGGDWPAKTLDRDTIETSLVTEVSLDEKSGVVWLYVEGTEEAEA